MHFLVYKFYLDYMIRGKNIYDTLKYCLDAFLSFMWTSIFKWFTVRCMNKYIWFPITVGVNLETFVELVVYYMYVQ